ncbi:MAG TPA: HEAT repeat domain-containing protein [Thermoanaerobaculia bacterium]|jgi:hypothetical protein
MPLLLAEELDPVSRELSHQHIENCPVCAGEWAAIKATWSLLGDLPEEEVPAHVKQRFLQRAGLAAEPAPANVVPFTRRPALKWIAQAAAVVLLVGGAYYAGDYNADRFEPAPLNVERIGERPLDAITPVSLSESRVLNAKALSPDIQGRPNIANVQFVDADASDDQIAVSFDVTSHWTVTGNPKEKSIVRLLSYMLENEEAMTPRSGAMEWVRRTYSDPANADPEIANALAKVLRNDAHEGVRLRAVETLTTLPPEVAVQTRDALIEALKSDPNPAVRLKAVEALARMTSKGDMLDAAMLDTLRAKASQDDENLYVRVKAAEALRNIKPN